MTVQYVIVRDGKFYTGLGWSAEYPDARIWGNYGRCRWAAKRIGRCTLVADYGLATEHCEGMADAVTGGR